MDFLIPFKGASRSALSKLNELVRFYNRMRHFTGDGLVKVSQTPTGLAFQLNMDGLQNKLAVGTGMGSFASADFWLAEVQEVTTAAGVYSCYVQTSFGVYIPPTVDVLNLLENYTATTPVPALGKGDILECYESEDNEGNHVWIGRPVHSCAKLFMVKDFSGDGQYLECNMMENDGTTEIISPDLGSGIDMYFLANKLSTYPAWKLKETLPRLEPNDLICAVSDGGEFRHTTIQQQSKDATCQE